MENNNKNIRYETVTAINMDTISNQKDRQKDIISTFIKDNNIKQRNEQGDGKEEVDSFGEIDFVGFGQFTTKRKPYIRVAEDTSVETLWELMIEEWKIPKPKMIISVTGGTKNFNFEDDRLKILFNQGLFKAAISTDAWIVTGGTSVGVMRQVGKAIKKESEGTTKNEVVALGIATWNVIDNRKALTNTSQVNLVVQSNGIGLADTKSQQEENIAIPVVLVVVEGGCATLETVYNYVSQNNTDGGAEGQARKGIPVVIVHGSGRAADIIAKSLRLTEIAPFNDAVKELNDDIHRMLGNAECKSVEDCKSWLKEICGDRSRKLITVFNMNDAVLKDIDRAILRGVLQGAALIASRILRVLSGYAKRKEELTLHFDLLKHAE
ncbi:transient receptor potential cation channel subfamily M member 2-like [Ptychodera flava]|uniref:transient receptor potential cation channel subfamily M member 2-like n=1 Tax=Ptychodera flava TaxID=63121 RepID=UPI00396A1F7D